jgi:hypothetical protein
VALHQEGTALFIWLYKSNRVRGIWFLVIRDLNEINVPKFLVFSALPGKNSHYYHVHCAVYMTRY